MAKLQEDVLVIKISKLVKDSDAPAALANDELVASLGAVAEELAGAGVVGIAIGFGAQSLVRDLVAGLFIIVENQYRVGDVVRKLVME